MNTKQLLYVLTLSHEGSFSKAADALNITQPSLSQYIKKIEKEVGQELFDRTNGDVRITDAGRVYIEAGRKILDIEHQMENAFTDLAAYKTGSLVVGAAPYRAAGMMPVVAAEFRKAYPGMHLVVREGTTAELADGMEHGEFDLALTLLPVDVRIFQWEKVMEEELVLAVPAGWDIFPAVPVADRKYPVADAFVLNGKALVMLTEAQYMQKQLQEVMEKYHLQVNTAGVVKSLRAQIEMVKAGVGMALVPSGIERFCRKDEVRFYSFKQKLPKREVVLMWRKDRELSKTAKILKNIILGIDW